MALATSVAAPPRLMVVMGGVVRLSLPPPTVVYDPPAQAPNHWRIGCLLTR